MKNNSKGKVKFSNVDILSFLSEVVQRHTKYYQSDFEMDKKIFLEAAEEQEQQNKTFVWLCRTHGTWCLQERDVFLKDTREYNTLKFYREQTTEPILAFLIEVMNVAATSVIGNIYALNYEEYSHHVVSTALPIKNVLLQYEHGYHIKEAETIINGYPDKEYGSLQSIQYQPYSQEELAGVLRNEQQKRKGFVEGNSEKYLAKL